MPNTNIYMSTYVGINHSDICFPIQNPLRYDEYLQFMYNWSSFVTFIVVLCTKAAVVTRFNLILNLTCKENHLKSLCWNNMVT